jgi:hypothetical protein
MTGSSIGPLLGLKKHSESLLATGKGSGTGDEAIDMFEEKEQLGTGLGALFMVQRKSGREE